MKSRVCAVFLVCGLMSLAAEPPKAKNSNHAVSIGSMPLNFEQNLGQANPGAGYVTRSQTDTVELRPSAVHLELGGKDKPSRPLVLQFENSNAHAKIHGEGVLPGQVNYFPSGNPESWITNVPTFSRVQDRNVYPGIDVAFYGNPKKLEFDFLVKQGTDPAQIRMSLRGSDRITLDAAGDLLIDAGSREIALLRPVIYQPAANGKPRQRVEGRYVVTGNQISFALGSFDRTRELVIDPGIALAYSEYMDSWAGAVAVDSSGNTYVAGPLGTSAGALYVTKLSSTGSVIYNNVVGSGSNAWVYGLAVDSTGRAYVAGQVYSGDTLPVTANAYSTTNTATYSAFLTVFAANGTSVVYGSYLGGHSDGSTSWAAGVALDSTGNAYLTGKTNSSTFPTTAGAYQTAIGTSWVAKLNPAASTGPASLVYSTFLGPNGTSLYGIAVDNAGDAYVTGNSGSTYPVTAGAFKYVGYESGSGGAYVTKLNPTGTALVYSSYLGYGTGYGIAVEGQSNPSAYVTGTVGFPDFPTTSGAYQTDYAGAFVTKLNSSGTSEVYSTFLGGPSSYAGNNIVPYSISLPYACASACNAYVAGWTDSPDYPAVNPIQSVPSTNSGYSAFVTEINSGGTGALFSTYFSGLASGVSNDNFDTRGKAPAIAVDAAGNMSLIGDLQSNQNDFPITNTNANPVEGFLARIGASGQPYLFALPVAFSNQPVGVSTSTYGGIVSEIVRNLGGEPATLSSPVQVSPGSIFSESDTCGGVIPAGGSCSLSLNFKPVAAGARAGTITISSNAANSPTVIPITATASDSAFLEPSLSSLLFPGTAVGVSSGTQTITLTNQGDQSTALAFTISQDYSEVNNCPNPLAPGASCLASITFIPTTTGLRSGTLTITSSGGPTATVTLTGTGTSSIATNALTLSAAALDFGTQTVTTTSGYETINVINTGTQPISILTIAASGDFTESTSCSTPGQLNAGAACTIYVYFAPTIAGSRTGTITVTDSASGSPHTTTLTGTGLASTGTVDLYPASIAVFPDTPIGLSSTAQTLYLENAGAGPITVDRVLVTGDYQITSDGCSERLLAGTLTDGQSATYSYCGISVAFTPTATGTRTGTVSFIDTASGSPHSITLTGNGIAATGSLALDPSAYNFGPEPQGLTSATQLVYLRNPGNTALKVTGISLSGDFSISSSECGAVPFTIAANSNCYLYVQFTPSATGSRSGGMTVASSAGSQTLALTGTGLSASQSIGLTPTSMNLGSIVTGVSGTYQYIFVRNTGTETVTFSANPTLSGSNAGDFNFSFAGCAQSGESLAANDSCYFYVRFSPSATGSRTATVTLTDSAGTQTLNLTGTGVASKPAIALNNYIISFNTQVQGTTSASQSVTLTNNGTTILALGNVGITGQFLIPHGLDTCSGSSIGAGGTCYVYVEFAPTSAGYQTGTLTFNGSGGTALSGVPVVPLAGYSPATAYSALADPTTTDFNTEIIGTTSSYSPVSLTNKGNTPFAVGTITGTNLGLTSTGQEFSVKPANGGIDNCSGVTVQPGGSCSVYPTFSPSATGTRTGTINFPVTYSNNSTATITTNLTGIGVADVDRALVNPSTASFVDQAQATTSNYVLPIYLYNSGNRAFSVGTVVDSDSAEFTITYNACNGASVSPASSCQINVEFTPSATGRRTASLTYPVTFADGTKASPVGTLTGNGIATAKTLEITPSSVGFPAQQQSVPSAAQTVTVINTGNVPITIGTDSVSVDPSEFAISSDGCAGKTLTYRQSCSFNLTFTPLSSSTGHRTGTVTIGDNASGGPHAVQVSGTAITGSQLIVLSQTTAAFGNQPAGSSSSTQYVWVSNQSNSNVPLTNIVLGGTNASDFTQTNNCPLGGSLGARGSCYIGITFVPKTGETGSKTATITETDSATGSPRTITITGTAVTPGPALRLYPSGFTFSKTNVGASSTPETISITNSGSANLKVTSLTATNGTEFPITFDGCGGVTLTPGQDCVFAVKFAPTLGGTRSGAVTIVDSAAGSPHTLALTGTGYGIPIPAFSPATLAFGSQNIGATSASQTVTLQNTGTDTLQISGISIAGVEAGNFSETTTCGASLAPGVSCTFAVTFKPTVAGSLGAALTVTDNAYNAGGSAQTVPLTGTGVASPAATTSASTLTFAAINVGSTSIQSVTLTNGGTGPLTISGVAISGTNASDYSETNNCGATLVAGSNCTISVTFKPTAAGTRTGTLTITDNANNVLGTHQTVGLTGIGNGLPIASVSPSLVGYSDQTVGTTSAGQVVTVSNTGAGTLAIASITITGANAGDFAQTNTCGSSVAAGANCKITVTFKPTATGIREATLTVTDNTGGVSGSTQPVSLFGEGK